MINDWPKRAGKRVSRGPLFSPPLSVEILVMTSRVEKQRCDHQICSGSTRYETLAVMIHLDL